MKTENKTEMATRSRRDVIKKVGVTSAFILPSIMSMNIHEVKAQASGQAGLNGFPTPPQPCN
jgi:hypothetical protein